MRGLGPFVYIGREEAAICGLLKFVSIRSLSCFPLTLCLWGEVKGEVPCEKYVAPDPGDCVEYKLLPGQAGEPRLQIRKSHAALFTWKGP